MRSTSAMVVRSTTTTSARSPSSGPVAVAAHQRPAAGDDGQAPGEPLDRRPPQDRAVGRTLGQRADQRLAHVPAVARPAGACAAGTAPAARRGRPAGRRTKPVSRSGGVLPALVAVGAPEGAGVQRPVDDGERVDVPTVRHRPSPPATPGPASPAARDPPDRVVPARRHVDGAVVPAHVVRVAHVVEPVVGPHTALVVGQQLAARGLLAGRPQQPPQPAPAGGQARGRQVVEGLGRRPRSGRRRRRPTCRTR